MPSPLLRRANPDDDFVLTEAWIPMRDGVELHTLILSPKTKRGPLPMLLVRTPYDAGKRLRLKQRTGLNAVLGAGLAALDGYIFVMQDIRGRYGSGGEFTMCRPPRGEFNTTETDETTDAWDTVDWLVRNVEANNGRAAIYGTSYDGWTSLMALLDPHPALKAAVPVNPLVDPWMGDDWFHNGAFRQGFAFEYVHYMETDLNAPTPFAFDCFDTYSWWLKAESPVALGKRYFDPEKHRFWTVLTENPAYTAYWKRSAADRLLKESTAQLIPTLHVHSWFDQEDIYGSPAAYEAMKPRDTANLIYFAAGPWHHGQNWGASERLAGLAWHADAARHWREDQLAPFLAHYLKDAPAHNVAPVSVFNTGTKRWERLDAWPAPKAGKPGALYLGPGTGLSWQPPEQAAAETYVSDPAKPVPYQPRPARRMMEDEVQPSSWLSWHAVDQRFVDGRPDVLTYVSDPIETPVTVRGAVTVKLFAETTGSDADWVVKLIDAYPDVDPADPQMGGYQFMISGEILRGRYRRSFETPEAITPNQVLEYAIRLPQVNHTFRKGHRLMVQVQSTWFPLYDRNPQRFVPSLMNTKPGDYGPATHRIHAGGAHASRIEVHLEGG